MARRKAILTDLGLAYPCPFCEWTKESCTVADLELHLLHHWFDKGPCRSAVRPKVSPGGPGETFKEVVGGVQIPLV
jgi:hypothetical protein